MNNASISEIEYRTTLAGVDWQEMKAILAEDSFDNGRTPAQLKKSCENSHSNCFAYADGKLIGTTRILSDGVCNAYLVDVWTYTPYRRQGVATQMIALLCKELHGQHIGLFTDPDIEGFYRSIGFSQRQVCFEKVVGHWLANDSAKSSL